MAVVGRQICFISKYMLVFIEKKVFVAPSAKTNFKMPKKCSLLRFSFKFLPIITHEYTLKTVSQN